MKTKFSAGQEVAWTPARSARSQRCTIVRVMPLESASRTYRIKGIADNCERAVPEEALAAIRRSEQDLAFER